MKQKIVNSLDAAVAGIPDGARIMFGGFGGAGFPNNLIQALSQEASKTYSRSAIIAARATENWESCLRTDRSNM